MARDSSFPDDKNRPRIIAALEPGVTDLPHAVEAAISTSCELHAAQSWGELRRLFEQVTPDLLLVHDLWGLMAEPSAVERLLKFAESKDCPILAMIERTDEQRPSGLLSAARDFVQVPFSDSELMLRIHRVIGANSDLPTRDEASSRFLAETKVIEPARDTPYTVEDTQDSDWHSLTRALRSAATQDPLTGLLNRRAFTERLDCKLTRDAVHGHEQFAVLFLDLDNFKLVNDSLGHDFGDAMLQEFAGRLTECVRTRRSGGHSVPDAVARLGGDEFVVLLDDLRDPRDAMRVANRILERLNDPFDIEGQVLSMRASIGVAFSDGPGCGATDVLRNADLAMYRAKQSGKARMAVYSASMHGAVARRMTLETALRDAVEQQELKILYQPIVDLSNGNIKSVEALLRWQHPTLGPIAPPEFITIAEETGLIVPLGRWLLKTACDQLVSWNNDSRVIAPISMNINVSRRQVVHPTFAAEFVQILEATTVDPANVNLEITETTVIDAGEVIEEKLLQLKETGVRLHMDDFGTGYSSLSYLHRLPVDCVKIDREFIVAMDAKRNCAAVVHAVIALARNLDLEVTAEGVETPNQLMQILAMDCDNAQGYHFAKPLEPDCVRELLYERQSWLEMPESVLAG